MKIKKILAVLLSVAMLLNPTVNSEAAELVSVSSAQADVMTETSVSGQTVSSDAASENTADKSETAEEETSAAESALQTAEISDDNIPSDGVSVQNTAVSSMLMDNFSSLSECEAGTDYVDDQVYFEAASPEDAENVAKEYGAELVSFQYGIGKIRFNTNGQTLAEKIMTVANTCSVDRAVYPDYLNEFFGDDTVSENMQAYSADDEVDAAGAISKCSVNDPDYEKQWYHSAINNAEAWTKSKGTSQSNGKVKVAVIDSGASLSHPDLKDNIVSSVNIANGALTAEDTNGHGSNVAGVIAAEADNGIGGAGVAPEAALYIYDINNAGSIEDADVIAAINAAASQGVNIISMSLGATGAGAYSQLEQDAINAAVNKGITVIAAAGNGIGNNGVGTSIVTYPAAYDNVIAVAAYDKNASLTYFSNYGSWVDIAAPGKDIYSCYKNESYVSMNGTSQATPIVSGIAALIYAGNDKYMTDHSKSTVTAVTRQLLNNNDGVTYSYKGHSVRGGANAAMATGVTAGKADVPARPVITKSVDPLTGAVSVSINASEGCTVYYTTDGELPDMTSDRYSGSFTISEYGSYKIRAIAVNPDATAVSSAAVLSFTVKLPSAADTPVMSLSSDVGNAVKVVPGKSIRLLISVMPNNARDKKLVYSVSENNHITVNSSGVIRVDKKAAAGEKNIVTASLRSNPGVKLNISVTAAEAVTSVSAGTAAVSLKTNDTYDLAVNLKPSDAVYRYTVSNKKILRVTSSGIVTAVGNGKARVTAAAMDGSGKKAVVTFSCTTPVSSITLKTSTGLDPAKTGGKSYIGTGGSIKLTPVLTGAATAAGKIKPSNTKVVWSSSNSGITVKNGKVSCPAGVGSGIQFTVTAEAKDGSGQKASVTFTTAPKKLKLMYLKEFSYLWYGYTRYFYLQYSSIAVRKTVGDTISIESPTRLACNQVYYYYASDKYYYLDKDGNKDANTYSVTVPRSSNITVTERSTDGFPSKVVISKKGTYNIVYTALDGSGKKFTVRIRAYQSKK